MVKLRFWKKDKPSTLQEDQTSQQLRQEAGLTRIKSTEDLASRILFTDTFFLNVERAYRIEFRNLLTQEMEKDGKGLTPEQNARLLFLQEYLTMFEAYRACKKSAMAWCTANEDEDMSERFRAFEIYFSRNWRNPKRVKNIIRMAMYLLDISFKAEDVAPAPTIIIQNLPKANQFNLSGWGEGDVGSEEVKQKES